MDEIGRALSQAPLSFFSTANRQPLVTEDASSRRDIKADFTTYWASPCFLLAWVHQTEVNNPHWMVQGVSDCVSEGR